MNDSDPLIYPSGPFFSFASGMTSIGWTSVCGESMGSHVYTFPAQQTQGTALRPSPEVLARLFCHYLVTLLPNEALPELVDDLDDLRGKYLKPARVTGSLLSSGSTRLKAKVGKSVPRPEIQLERE
jgi:hypothetical protein